MKAYILAGGKSSRMGEDKGLKLLAGRPMISYIIDTIATSFTEIFILSNQSSYDQFQLPVKADEIKELGPLGALYTAIKHSPNDEALFICSCDMPLIDTNTIQFLLENYRAQNIVASYNAQIHPLFGIYQTAHLPLLEKKIQQQELKMMSFIEETATLILPFEKKFNFNPFQNVNTPVDFEQIQKQIQP